MLWCCLGMVACGSVESEGERWPGPCRAQWAVYRVIEVGSWRLPTPFTDGPKRQMLYTYDDHGRLIRSESDRDDDGVVDGRVMFYYDEYSRVIREVFDRGADDTMDEERAFAYTEDGSPIGFYRHEGVDALEPMEMEVGYAPMTRLWEVCQGDCTYDAHGNLLEDRDLYRQDAVYYDYTCWTER
ncbi:MAG: hypothetical protein AAFX99_06855 [Myxococcota bacterium]